MLGKTLVLGDCPRELCGVGDRGEHLAHHLLAGNKDTSKIVGCIVFQGRSPDSIGG